VGWIVIGVLAFAGGIFMLLMGKPGGRANGLVTRHSLIEQVYGFVIMLALVLGIGMLIKGAVNLFTSGSTTALISYEVAVKEQPLAPMLFT
jgi:predicted permease